MYALLSYALITRKWPVLLKYTLTFLCIIIASFLHTLIFGDYGAAYTFILFYPVIILTSIFLDQGNGIFAAILGSIVATLYINPIQIMASSGGSAEVIAIILFLIIGLMIAIFLEGLHKFFTTLNDANQQIAVLANARGVLLRELTHRTRNDMAALNSLFLLQAHTLKDPVAQQAFKNAAQRMQIIARVHERLTVESDQIAIDSKSFITDLCDDLRLGVFSDRPVALNLAIESHPMSHQKAVAVGLIINELVTNALKYAFPNAMQGKIAVRFKKDENSFHLYVSDNGVGMATVGDSNGTGLGLELVRTLAAQLGGELVELHQEKGTGFEIIFPAG